MEPTLCSLYLIRVESTVTCHGICQFFFVSHTSSKGSREDLWVWVVYIGGRMARFLSPAGKSSSSGHRQFLPSATYPLAPPHSLPFPCHSLTKKSECSWRAWHPLTDWWPVPIQIEKEIVIRKRCSLTLLFVAVPPFLCKNHRLINQRFSPV